jgi:hypothetical protein
MSSPPQQQQEERPPPTFVPLTATAGGDRDAPREGRLARADPTSAPTPTNLTRGGNRRAKFTPKAVPRKIVDEYYPLGTLLIIGKVPKNPKLLQKNELLL